MTMVIIWIVIIAIKIYDVDKDNHSNNDNDDMNPTSGFRTMIHFMIPFQPKKVILSQNFSDDKYCKLALFITKATVFVKPRFLCKKKKKWKTYSCLDSIWCQEMHIIRIFRLIGSANSARSIKAKLNVQNAFLVHWIWCKMAAYVSKKKINYWSAFWGKRESSTLKPSLSRVSIFKVEGEQCVTRGRWQCYQRGQFSSAMRTFQTRKLTDLWSGGRPQAGKIFPSV